jgi:DNA adenine methylase
MSNGNGSEPRRPALRYYGGKWKIGPWIIRHFPEHYCYVEPFGGAASVLMRKAPSRIEVYNDLAGDVVNFFRVLRHWPRELIRAIELTPFSREEFELSMQPVEEPLERARRLHVRCWQGRGRAGVMEPGGWRFAYRASRSQTPADDWNNNGHLWDIAERLKRVQIENRDALEVIGRYDGEDTLFYCDPPYVQSERCKRWASEGYLYEMDDAGHRELGELLHQVRGYVVLSGYPSELYDELYGDWVLKEKAAVVDGGRVGGREVSECVWLSPRTSGALDRQLRLF